MPPELTKIPTNVGKSKSSGRNIVSREIHLALNPWFDTIGLGEWPFVLRCHRDDSLPLLTCKQSARSRSQLFKRLQSISSGRFQRKISLSFHEER